MDGEGNEVRRIVDDRRAGRRREAPLPLGRPRRRRATGARRRLPHAGGPPRRGPRGRLVQGDPRRPHAAARAAASRPSPSVIAPREPGQAPRGDAALPRARATTPPSSASSAPTTGRAARGPPLPRRRPQQRRLGRRGGDRPRRAPARRPTATTPSRSRVRDRAGNLAVAPAEIPSARDRAARHRACRCAASRCAGPLGGRARRARVADARGRARSTARFDFVLSRLGDPERDPPRRARRRALPGGHPARRAAPACTSCACAPGRQRAVWPLAVAGLPQIEARGRAARARWWCCPAITWQGLNPVDDDLDGFADTLAEGALGAASTGPFAGGGLPAALRRRDGAAAALPRPRAARLRPDHRRLARPRRGPGARQRARRGVRRQRAVAARAAAARACATRWRTALRRGLVRRRLVPAHGARSRRAGCATRAGRGGRTPSASAPRCSRTSPAPLTVFEDGSGCSRASTTFIGDFTMFEQSRGLPERGARRSPRAGRDPSQPAFVAYGLGGGLVIRTGTAAVGAASSTRRR